MNAINFIKLYGLNSARVTVEGAQENTHYCTEAGYYSTKLDVAYEPCPDCVDLSELKRLVESVDLVNKLGGIVIAREKLTYGNSISAMRLSYETTITGRDGTKQNVITGVYLEDLKQAIADYESIYSNDMGDDTHIENNISPLCLSDSRKNESQSPLSIKQDALSRMESCYIEQKKHVELLQTEVTRLNSTVERLKAENKMLHEAAATHLKNQMHFKKLYDALVEQLYPYALSLDGPVGTAIGKEYCDGYNRARAFIHYDLMEMMESDEEYIRAQCGMLGGGSMSRDEKAELQKRVDKAIRLLVEAELYQSEPNIDLAVQASSEVGND